MTHRIRVDGQRFIVESYSLPAMIFGAIFAIGGLQTLPAIFFAESWIQVVLLPFGVAIFVVGGVVLGFRHTCVIVDARRKTVSVTAGVRGLAKAVEHPLVAYDGVIVEKAGSGEEGPHAIVFPVVLSGGAHRSVIVHEGGDYQEARALAERLASFASLPLVDRASGTELVRSPDRLDASLRQLASSDTGSSPSSGMVEGTEGATSESSPPPSDARSSWTSGEEEDRIEIPAWGMGKLTFGGVAIFLLVTIGVVAGAWLLSRRAPDGGFVGTVVACLLVGGCIELSAFLGMKIYVDAETLSHRLVVSSRGLLVEAQTIWGREVHDIPGEDVEELELIGPVRPDEEDCARFGILAKRPRILLRTDQRSLEFGRGLSWEELAWIRGVLHRRLTR